MQHLKNFSLLTDPQTCPIFSPAYVLVATKLVNAGDDEDLALTLNGKKKKIKRSDFEIAFKNARLEEKQQQNIFKKMDKAKVKWFDFIDIDFLNDEFKKAYENLIEERFNRLSS